MRALFFALTLPACVDVARPTGDLTPGETCALLDLAWSAAQATPCPTDPLSTCATTLHVEPIGADPDRAAVDLAVCLSVTGGASFTPADADAWVDAAAVDAFPSDDGAMACVGLTAALVAAEDGAELGRGSYWWRAGSDASDGEADAWGAITADGAAIALARPTFLADAIEAPALVLSTAARDHFDDPACDADKGDL